MQLSWSLLMLVTQHVSGVTMPIIRSTVKDDKPHTVFCTGRAVVDLRRWGGSRVHVMVVVIQIHDKKCVVSRLPLTRSAIKPKWMDKRSYTHSHQVHTWSTSSPQVHSVWPVQETVCGLSLFTGLLMMGIMMPETCWVTNINKPQLNCI
jgi:hypothetical protein